MHLTDVSFFFLENTTYHLFSLLENFYNEQKSQSADKQEYKN